MFKRFLILEWKSFVRAASFQKSLALKIILGFIALYFITIILFLGISIYPILKETHPDVFPIYSINNYAIMWLVSEFYLRFMFQKIPALHIRPLLITNVTRRQMAHFVLMKSVFSVFNILSPLIIIPFAIWNFYTKDVSAIATSSWAVAMLTFSLCMNFLSLLLKKKFNDSTKGFIVILCGFLALIALEKFQIINFTVFFGHFFRMFVTFPFMIVTPIGILVIFYLFSFHFLNRNLYLDTILEEKTKNKDISNFSWVKYFGKKAIFLELDLKLLWRNKRGKSIIWTSLFFCLYGLIFYGNSSFYESYGWLIFVGIFLSASFVSNFGQFIPAWDSSYYSMLMAQNVSMKQYLSSKMTLLHLSVLVTALLCIPYVFFGWHILLVNISCAIYNIGINVPIILFFGAFNRKRIELDKSSFSNMQGTSTMQFVAVLPLLLLPIIIWYLAHLFLNEIWATLSLSIIGIIGFLLKDIFIESIAKKYKSQKYKTISGFKQVSV